MGIDDLPPEQRAERWLAVFNYRVVSALTGLQPSDWLQVARSTRGHAPVRG